MKDKLLTKPPERKELADVLSSVPPLTTEPEPENLPSFDELVSARAREVENLIEKEEDQTGSPFDEDERNEALAKAARELNAPVVRALLRKGASEWFSGFEAEEKNAVSALFQAGSGEGKMREREHPLLAGLNAVYDDSSELNTASYKLILRDYLRVIGTRVHEIRTLRSKRTLVMSMIAKSQFNLATWYLQGCEIAPAPRKFPPDLYLDDAGEYPYVDNDGNTFLDHLYDSDSGKLREFVALVKDERTRAALLNHGLASAAGETLLMRASRHGNRAAVRVLLKFGADPMVADKKGETAPFYALRFTDPKTSVPLRYFFTRKGHWRSYGAYKNLDLDRAEEALDAERFAGSDDDNALAKASPARHIKRVLSAKGQSLLHGVARLGNSAACRQLLQDYDFADVRPALPPPRAPRSCPPLSLTIMSKKHLCIRLVHS
eukprot:tig00000828_g4641.t1